MPRYVSRHDRRKRKKRKGCKRGIITGVFDGLQSRIEITLSFALDIECGFLVDSRFLMSPLDFYAQFSFISMLKKLLRRYTDTAMSNIAKVYEKHSSDDIP